MSTKKSFLNDIENGKELKTSLMVLRVMYKDTTKIVCILTDKTGEIKATLPNRKGNIKEGMVLNIEGKKDGNLEVKKYEIVTDYSLADYLPTVKRNIEDILSEIDSITNEFVISKEGRALNDYFFSDSTFLERFKNGIGGVSMHHNYIGGLAEHTLGVMKLTKVYCENYNCKRPEIAILSAKLHDIGKIKELNFDGPFKYTLEGELHGHIVIGSQMLYEAFNSNKDLYSDDFKNRILGCIIQHHGKLEYGSPRDMKTEEAYIVHLADYVDATLNKIENVFFFLCHLIVNKYDHVLLK